MSIKRVVAITCVLGASGIAAVAVPGSVSALTGTVSAAAFASACAAGPVNLAPSAKIEFGSASIVGGCTVNIPFDGALEVVDATLSFGGPLVINGGEKSKFEVVGSSVSASSVSANMTSTESSVKVDKGSLRATAGNLDITMGRLGSVQIAYPAVSNPTSLQASGAVNISGGDLLKTELNTSRVQAASFSLAMNGVEGGVLAQGATVVTTGALSITAAGSKALLESSGSTFQAGGATTVSLDGGESIIKGTATAFRAGGAVTISAAANGFGGLVELGGPGGVVNGGSVIIRASNGAEGDKGVAKVGLNTVTATAGSVTVATGNQGTTAVTEATLTATTSLTVSSAVTGVCLASLNAITAPVTSICL